MTQSKEVSWFTKIFEDYFIVELYLQGGTTRTFHMKEIKKINNKQLKGKNLSGHGVDYCTAEPFDYYVKKIY